MPPGTRTLFEAVNETARELYVSSTTLSMHELISEHARRRPDAVRHWGAQDVLYYRSLDFDLPPDEARRRVEGYVPSSDRAGWRVLRAPEGEPRAPGPPDPSRRPE